MKHKLGNKEFNIVHAPSRAVMAIEKEIGKPISALKDDPAYEHICTIYAVALTTSDPTVERDWIFDTMKFADMQEQAEVVAYFLEIPSA
jgi:hypothetical protein